jgi:hypothetical protein
VSPVLNIRFGSNPENLNASKTLPLLPQQRTSPGGSIFRGAYDPGDVLFAELELPLVQPTPKQLVPEP